MIDNEDNRQENSSPIQIVSSARNIPIAFSQEELLFVDDHVTLMIPPQEFHTCNWESTATKPLKQRKNNYRFIVL